MVDPNHGMAEATGRHEQMVRLWARMGHLATACVGHTYPLPDCPAPEVHGRIFPPEDALTFDKMLAALKAVFSDLDSTGRAGDEWAYEWIHEVWPTLVPPVVRRAVGDPEAPEAGA